MDSDVLAFFNNIYSRRVSSIVALFSSFFCSTTQAVISSDAFSSDPNQSRMNIIHNISNEDLKSIIATFDELEHLLQSSVNVVDSGHQFLHSFIEELNSVWDLNLTIDMACELVRENMNNFSLPLESLDILDQTISFLESDFTTNFSNEQTSDVISCYSINSLKVNLLPKWLDKKIHKNKKSSTQSGSPFALQIDRSDIELPADIYVGGIEMFAGVLILALGLVYPAAAGLGLGMLGDGARRVFDGVTEIGNRKPQEPFKN